MPFADPYVAPGFEAVRDVFEENFRSRGEIGAAVAAFWRGEKVVDLWGGRRCPDAPDRWEKDTLVCVMSATKGMAALALAVAHGRGFFDHDAPVAEYWPEFAQNGKAEITIRQLLNHEAGLVLLDTPLSVALMRDLDVVAKILARQKPAWAPGSRHGYHTMSLGLYMQELIRRTDPQKRTLGQFFHEEIAVPLGLDFHIGLPASIPQRRLAQIATLNPMRALTGFRKMPLPMIFKMLQPNSMLRRSFLLGDLDWNDREMLEVELPAGNGVGTARAMACAYASFAEGGAALGVPPATLDALTAPPDLSHPRDAVLGVKTAFSLGFLRPSPHYSFGSGPMSFGAPGAGGSFAFADPAAQIGYAYVTNTLDFYLFDDPREKALRDALYASISALA